MTVALSAWILAAGGLAAGASALTGSDDAAGGAGGGKAAKGATLNADGVPFTRDGRECKAGHGRHKPDGASRLSQSDF